MCAVPEMLDADYLVVGAGRRDGVHRRAGRPRGRQRRHGRSPPRRRRTLAGRVSVRPRPPGLAVLWRGLDAARRRPDCSRTGPRPDCTSGRRRPRSAPTTNACCRADARVRAGAFYARVRVPRRPHVRLAGVRDELYKVRDRCARRRRPLPRRRGSRPRTRRRSASAEGVVVPVNELVSAGQAPAQYVIVGSGKTATDACVWLLDSGVEPDPICWVRPRDPWMLNRAVIQPDPRCSWAWPRTRRCGGRGCSRRRTICSCGWRTRASCSASTAP